MSQVERDQQADALAGQRLQQGWSGTADQRAAQVQCLQSLCNGLAGCEHIGNISLYLFERVAVTGSGCS